MVLTLRNIFSTKWFALWTASSVWLAGIPENDLTSPNPWAGKNAEASAIVDARMLLVFLNLISS